MFSSNTTQVSDGGYQISRSLRFNSADSTYLNRTPATAGNRKQWSWSVWFKVATVGTEIHFFGASQNSCYLRTDSTLQFIYGATNYRITSQVFRDVGAWMHLVVVWDSPNATVADRLRFYINGVQVTAFSTNNAVTLNDDSGINSVTAHNIGRFYGGSDYFNGYMTEINFIDGQALTASSFGETNAQTGVWQPKAYSGSYGTNGFYLNFSDNSNTTAATLGKDYSGNGNNWTPNNFSVTAGAGNDSLVDSPTSYGVDTGVGGTVRGNYSTMNPLNKSSAITLANGNLDVTQTTTKGKVLGTIGVTSGKWYWEITAIPVSTYGALIGLAQGNSSLTVGVGEDANSWAYANNGFKYTNSTGGAYGTGYPTGGTIGVSFDADTGTLAFYLNGTAQGTAYTGLTSGPYFPAVGNDGMSYTANFGQRPFAYTAPSGFKALCTQNLPTPTIGATTATTADKYFGIVLRNGTGTTGGTFSTTVNMANGALIWEKPRNFADQHQLVDSVRGISKYLSSNTTAAEGTDALYFTAFGTNSYTMGTSDWPTNRTLVDWMWAANGSGSTNTAGSITSTVSANTTSGFSVVTYTGNGSNATVGHGLGVAPSMVIVKQRNTTRSWIVYNINLGATKYIVLDSTNAAATYSFFWNDTAPTSTVFSIGTDGAVNTSGGTYVAYCFAEVAGYSKFGSYTGNGSADGPFVYTGFRPAYVMIKNTSEVGNSWAVFDNKRNTYNVMDLYLLPNSSGAESSFAGLVLDFDSNGFKIRGSQDTVNKSANNYIFACFAETPFKYSLAR